jgi:hypothetical protein
MAFTSIGYDGSVNERQWAELVPSVGSSTYGVKGAGDLKVTAVPGQPGVVSVAAGSGWGHGVYDTQPTNTTIACDSITSGTRWDLIALRRDWQPLAGGPTTVAKVTGTTDKVIPGTRKQSPGVEDDQPLALVQWTAGQTQPTAIIDLRCWAGNGGLVANDELALTYLAKLGAAVRIGPTLWAYRPGANDVPSWAKVADNKFADVPWTNMPMAQGFDPVTTDGWSGLKYAVKGGWVMVNGAVRRSTPWGSGMTVAVMPSAYKPAHLIQGTNNAQCEPSVGNIGIPAGSGAVSFSLTWPLF